MDGPSSSFPPAEFSPLTLAHGRERSGKKEGGPPTDSLAYKRLFSPLSLLPLLSRRALKSAAAAAQRDSSPTQAWLNPFPRFPIPFRAFGGYEWKRNWGRKK